MIILPAKYADRIKERCGENVTADGLECPHCGALETYKSADEPKNVDKWFFVIRAFRVDDQSHCTNCDNWFGL